MNNPKYWLGISLKMYFGYQDTLTWCHKVRELVNQSSIINECKLGIFILPSYPLLTEIPKIFAGSPVKWGAQNVAYQESGALTGEVSASLLQEIGCDFVEIGHYERKRFLAESDEHIARKLVIALRHRFTPILCIGEELEGDSNQAIESCWQQLTTAFQGVKEQNLPGEVIVAYEPQWAIGAPQPAPVKHIVDVCQRLKEFVCSEHINIKIIYGGSAGIGLLKELDNSVDGLFLGRFAHDIDSLKKIIIEAEENFIN